MEDRRNSDRSLQQINDTLSAIRSEQEKIAASLNDQSDDMRSWRKEMQAVISAHGTTLTIIKTLGAGISAIVGFLGADRFLGK